MTQALIEFADNDSIAKVRAILGKDDKIIFGSPSEIIEQFKLEDDTDNRCRLPSHDEIYAYLSELFLQIGLPANLLGYGYLQRAIELALLNSSYLRRNVTKRLYPDIAKASDTKSQRVERSIRHAITATWDRGNIQTLNELFGSIVSPDKGKPTNSEFIARSVQMTKAYFGRKAGIRFDF